MLIVSYQQYVPVITPSAAICGQPGHADANVSMAA
jgi:hypothetical protein